MAAIAKLTLRAGMEPYPGYRLTAFLGSGGWGEVWKATRADGGAVALKFLPSDSQSTTTQEARALQAIRQLQHPHLLRPDNIWSCPGYLVIVMELADGNLLDLLGVYRSELNTPLPPEHLCFFMRHAALAIDFLNQKQHVVNGQRVAFRHCDIKPSNLLVVGNTVKVSDFSLAVQTNSPKCHGRCAGTPAYAAPEVFHGLLSDRSDQYALATTYYHLRTGALPFKIATFDKKYERPPVDLAFCGSAERAVLARAFALVPQDRWPNCVEFVDQLSRCFVPATMVG